MEPAAGAKPQTLCRHRGSSEIGKSSKTVFYQAGKNSNKRTTKGENYHHTTRRQGNAKVVVEKKEYQEKMGVMLSDQMMYEKLKEDPTRKS